MRGSVVGVVAAVLVAVVVSVAIVAAFTGSDRAALVDLEVGDCFDLSIDAGTSDPDAAVDLERVEVLGCDRPHEAEVVLVAELNPSGDLDYPSDAELFDAGDVRCATVGVADEAFGLVPIVPDELTWRSERGRMVCVAVPIGGGTTTGSVLAAAG